jgi:hypothetical protein
MVAIGFAGIPFGILELLNGDSILGIAVLVVGPIAGSVATAKLRHGR